MSVIIDGSNGITTNSGTVVSSTDGTIHGLTVGLGGGSDSGSTTIGGSSLGGNSTNTGADNSAFGFGTLYVNTSGSSNCAFGRGAMRYNTSGGSNSAFGYQALNANISASNNTAIGYQAGYTNQTGAGCTYIGGQSGQTATGNYNSFLGQGSGYLITSGAKNSIIGTYSGNQGGLDIRTANNYIVLSDGDGNPRAYWNGSGVGNFINAVGGTGVLRLQNTTNASGDAGLINTLGSNANNTSSYHFIGTISGVGDKIYIYGNGNIQNSNNSYGGISDVKLKENIVDATPKLDDLLKVQVRNYNLKTDPSHKQLGVIAQELEKIFPSMVEESTDRDTEGNLLGTTTKSVKYSIFVPMLVKAIQEQQALIQSLTTRIATLESAGVK